MGWVMSFQDEQLPEYAMPGDFSPEERLQLYINHYLEFDRLEELTEQQELSISDMTGFFTDLT